MTAYLDCPGHLHIFLSVGTRTYLPYSSVHVLRLLGALMTMIHVVNRKPEYMDMDMYTSLQHMMKDVDVQSTARRTRNFVARYGIVLIGAKHLYAEAAPAPAQFS